MSPTLLPADLSMPRPATPATLLAASAGEEVARIERLLSAAATAEQSVPPLGDAAEGASANVSASSTRRPSANETNSLLVTDGLAGHMDSQPWAYMCIVAIALIAAVVFAIDFVSFLRERSARRQDAGGGPGKGEEAQGGTAEAAAPAETAPTVEGDEHKQPRRWMILAACLCSVSATDIYIAMPNVFYAVEMGERGGPQSLVSLYLGAVQIGGLMISIWLVDRLFAAVAANRINRLTLLLSCFTALWD